MQNAEMNEAQAGNNIAGRNINSLRYSDDTTLLAESKEKLKNLLMIGKKTQMCITDFWTQMERERVR